jgi:hypothetical protein
MSLQTELYSNSILYAKRGHSCELGEKYFFSKMTPLNFVKIVFRNFFLFNAPEGFFTHFQKQIFKNLAKLVLSARGTTLSL